MPEVERKHRLSVARAWEADDRLGVSVQRWVDTGSPAGYTSAVANELEGLERLAQLVADAEGAWIPCEERMPIPTMDLPDDAECFLQVFAPARGVDVAAWDGERWLWRSHGYAIPSEVTHWAPLLSPPTAPKPPEQP